MASLSGATVRPAALLLFLAASFTACSESTGVGNQKTIVAAVAGDAQFALPGSSLSETLQVSVVDATTKEPREDITVTWRVVSGGGVVTPATSTTDSRGIATASLRVGPSLGANTVSATTSTATNPPVTFTATAIRAPSITSVAPTSARGGDTVSINGSDFGADASTVSVLFAGIRASVVSANDNQLRVIVPPCAAANGAATVRVARGAVQSGTSSVGLSAVPVDSLRMSRGEVRVMTNASQFGCFRIPGTPAGASYMLIPQNAADVYSVAMSFELTSLAVPGGIIIASRDGSPASNGAYADRWELALRLRERAILDASAGAIVPPASLRATGSQVIPQVGDRRSFNTLNINNESVKITAEVRAVTTHAILYQDVTASNVLTTADYEHFGAIFDDPVYNTDTSVFGAVSDIDNNGRVIIVLTPAVNRLTPKGTGSFIGGYFYACDLLPKNRCTATNSGEIFYSMVPDPTGAFGDPHSASTVLRNVPPVVAHEFMHMINFSRRGTLDDLWLGEALAHTAEDIVGQVFLDRGDATTAADFIEPNHINARLYLADISDVSLVANETPGTIELRGAGWLFLRYLRGLYGENTLLSNLTGSKVSGTKNVVAATGKSWASLVSDFAVALYADDNPDLAGVQLDPRYTFVNANVRQMLGNGTFYPLATRTHSFSNFNVTDALPSSTWQYEYVQAPVVASASLNMSFSGRLGGGFNAATVPQLTVLRVR